MCKYVRFLWDLIKDLSKFLNLLLAMSERFTNNVDGDSDYISGSVQKVYDKLFKLA
jgi:hypothetical protein